MKTEMKSSIMKTITIMIAIYLTSLTQAFAQPIIDGTAGKQGKTENNIIVNLKGGILYAEQLTNIDNSHWIKKGQFINQNNTVTVDFKDRLYVNNEPVIEQIHAEHGYVVFFSDNFDYALVYLADKDGRLNSDELYINLK